MAAENVSPFEEEMNEDPPKNPATPIVNRPAGNSATDTTPSRRSSRKKQSTFSSDFEYYTPTGRKKEIKDEELKPITALKGKPLAKVQKRGKQQGTEEESNGDDEGSGSRKPMRRKVALRKQREKDPSSVEENEDEEQSDTESAKPKTVKGNLKVAARKRSLKDSVMQKNLPLKHTEESEEEEDKGSKDEVQHSTKGLKRKKMARKVNNKTRKTEKEEEMEESSNEEDSTPISQLKMQLKQHKDLELEATVSSSVAQNLVQRLVEASSDTSSSPGKSTAVGLKRRHASDGEDDEVPLKQLQTTRLVDVEKLAPALAGLVKRLPPTDLGLVRRSPSEIAAKSNPVQKTKHSESTFSKDDRTVDSSHKDKAKSGEALGCAKKSKISTLNMEVENFAKKTSPTIVDKARIATEDVKVQTKVKKYVGKVQVTKRSDSSDAKAKSGQPKSKMSRKEDGKSTVSEAVGSEKLLGTQKKKLLASHHEVQTSGRKGNISSGKKLNRKADDMKPKELDQERPKSDEADTKMKANSKMISPGDGKTMKPTLSHSKNVDDLLKRGIIHKKKSHQPFGNKKMLARHFRKDEKTDFCRDSKQGPMKKKPSQRIEEKGEMKKTKDVERRKSSDVPKQGRDRSHANVSFKAERRKSAESVKRSDKLSNMDVEDKKDAAQDGPPPLLPVSTASGVRVKHKHPKPEHEVPMDMTMMDLFKPDGLIVHDQQKKEEVSLDEKLCGPEDRKSQYAQDVYDSESYVKPENLHHVLIEHQYSKPSSPDTPKLEKSVSACTETGRKDDIESVSHKQTVLIDMNLPDQILEESEEPVIEECADGLQETWPENMEELQQMMSKNSSSDRSSILESLDSELKESGTEFRIVGQVEVGRLPVASSQEDLLSSVMNNASKAAPTGHTSPEKKQKESQKYVNTKKSSTDLKRSRSNDRRESSEKRKDSVEKRTDKDSSSFEKKNCNVEGRKPKKLQKADVKGEKSTEVKEEEEESDEHEFEDDENDFDWEPNDSDTLYCLCQKPHNNRFMICCDKCEEWFHGTCVGITRARGKEMEEKEEEYICPVCTKQDGSKERELQSSPTVSKAKDQPASPKAKLQQRCVGRKCNKIPRPGSVYCSNECIMNHAQDSLKAIREEQMRQKMKHKHHSLNESSKTSSDQKREQPSTLSSGDKVEVVERQTGKVLKGSSAPSQKGLHRWLEQHPTFEVVQPYKHRSSSSRDKHREKDKRSDKHSKSPSERDRKNSLDSDREKKFDRAIKTRHGDKSRHDSSSSRESGKRSDSEGRRGSTSHRSEASSSSSKTEEKRAEGPNQIRMNVRTALRDSLTARAHEADDIMLSSNEIKSLALTIEEELFSLFNDTGHKYRTKYRSLVFNIKDQKNKGLFCKILTGKIKPHKLVQMSTEELASKELAKWREQESKHQLEMIEKTEQEALKESESVKHVRKKTHKGEVEVEDEDLSILETRLEDKKEPEPEHQEEQAQEPVIDTTDQHRAHLFDLNCKVCTGKIIPGPEEQAAIAAATKIKVSHAQPQDEQDDESALSEKEDFARAEEIVKEALRTIQKTEQEVSSLPKIVSSPPKQETSPPPLSPKISTSRRESSSSASSASSLPTKKKVVVRSPDSALQSGLEAKPKFTPTGPVIWKGFVSMLDVAKFFTSAYRVSGPTDHITIPDTIHIMGRISPDHMWDYLSKIRQAGSKDLTVIRFIPGSDDEKVAYVHLYSYLNSRGRCGVAGNPNKQIKDFYVVPLASHSKIPRTLLPFDGPGLEENRPHMLIGILVRQKGKHGPNGSDTSDSGNAGSDKANNQKTSSGSTKRITPTTPRDPRLAKLVTKDASPKVSPTESNSSASSAGDTKIKLPAVEEYEPEYIPMPVKAKNSSKPVAEYIPTPTIKKKDKDREKNDKVEEEKTPPSDDSSSKEKPRHDHHRDHHHHHHSSHDHHRHSHDHHHHHQHHKKQEELKEMEDDSEPYSPGKEAEPYSPGQEAAADEPYDPGDESLMDDTGVPIISNSSSTTITTANSIMPFAAAVAATMAATSTAVVSVLSRGSAEPQDQSPVLNAPASQKGERVRKMTL